MDNMHIDVKYMVVSAYFRDEYLPQYASDGAAGMDLHAVMPESVVIQPGERVRIPTGIAIQLPGPHVVALVYARSGLAWRHGVALPNGVGVIDSDYTGEVEVLLTNFGETAVEIKPGDRIAQMVFTPIHLASWLKVDVLAKTTRGERGFGSTGVAATQLRNGN